MSANLEGEKLLAVFQLNEECPKLPLVMDPFCFSFTIFIVVLYLLKKKYMTAAHISKVTPGHRTVSNIVDTRHKEVP